MGFMSIAAWSLFYWSNTNRRIQLAVVFYEFVENFKVPYFAYIFAKVTKDHYSTVSSLTYAAVFAGNYVGLKLPELITSEQNVKIIFYSIFSAQIIATFITLCLPGLSRMQSSTNLCSHSVWMFEQLKATYTNGIINLWSLWFIVGTVILNQFTFTLFPMILLKSNDSVSLHSIFFPENQLISM